MFKVLFVLLLASSVHADGLDYKVGAEARTIPQNATLFADGGYGYSVWGDAQPGKVFYGYIRPAVTLFAAGIVNAADVHLDLYPISFFGFTAGAFVDSRTGNVGSYQCSFVVCQGTVQGNYLKARLLYELAGVIFVGNASWKNLQAPASSQAFLDEWSDLLGNPGGDTLMIQDYVLGYRIDPQIFAGVDYRQQIMQGSRTNSVLLAAVASYNHADNHTDNHLDYKFTVGAGEYTDPTVAGNGVIFGRFEWFGLRAIGLN